MYIICTFLCRCVFVCLTATTVLLSLLYMYIICAFLCRCLSSPVSPPLLSYCHYFICTSSVPSCVRCLSSPISHSLLSYCHYVTCTSSVPSCVRCLSSPVSHPLLSCCCSELAPLSSFSCSSSGRLTKSSQT